MTDSQTIMMDSLKSLVQWVDQEGPYGWDLYDALNGPWNQKLKNPYLRVLLIQINKYSPLNLRPLLKVEKGLDLKGTALLTQAYTKMYRLTLDEMYLEKIVKGLEFIVSKSLRNKYGYDCWASHYYPYASIDHNHLEPDLPDIIGTSQSIIALIEGYKILHAPKYLDMANSASRFLTNVLYQENDHFSYFKYATSEVTEVIVPNASAHALEALSSVLQVNDNCTIRDICEKTAYTLIKIQRDDGSWMYSIYPDGKPKRMQLDFHQGYMVDGIQAFLQLSENKDNIFSCVEKGTNFYKNVLFRLDGSSYYRHPLPYPVDIHNQAQGIITFSKIGVFDKYYLESAKSISMWTIENMQDESGHFYYQKWPFVTNKTPHMRWGQAWMMLALATFIETVKGKNHD